MRDYRAAFSKLVFVAVLAAGIIAIIWSWSQPFQACAVEPLTELLKLALSQYSGTVQQVLTLSTALAALGAAVLLGLHEAPRLTESRRVLILASTCCFVFSAYFGLLWQSWLATLLLLECPGSITQPVMKIGAAKDLKGDWSKDWQQPQKSQEGRGWAPMDTVTKRNTFTGEKA
jgi:hypothetical protein